MELAGCTRQMKTWVTEHLIFKPCWANTRIVTEFTSPCAVLLQRQMLKGSQFKAAWESHPLSAGSEAPAQTGTQLSKNDISKRRTWAFNAACSHPAPKKDMKCHFQGD